MHPAPSTSFTRNPAMSLSLFMLDICGDSCEGTNNKRGNAAARVDVFVCGSNELQARTGRVAATRMKLCQISAIRPFAWGARGRPSKDRCGWRPVIRRIEDSMKEGKKRVVGRGLAKKKRPEKYSRRATGGESQSSTSKVEELG